jgi:undecaprenyl phosphate-alpha-L-ara4N flippase subunit ArnE
MSKYIIYALVTVILISIGQVLFKFSSKDLMIENISDIIEIISNKYLISALAIYTISTALWIFTLSKIELGVAYLLLSLSYPLIILLSYIFFQEELSSYKLITILLIVLANIILILGENL